MTPTLQTRPHPNGDCTRACIAALLDTPINLVPDFTGMDGALELHETRYPNWYLAMQQWLASKGFQFIEIHLSEKTWFPLPLEMLAIFIGPHETGCRHSIVGKCEGESFFPIFDPLGGDPTQAFVNGHIDAVCFLVPIDPALQLRLGKASDAACRLVRQIPNHPDNMQLKYAALENLEGALNVGKAIEIPELNRPRRSEDSNGG